MGDVSFVKAWRRDDPQCAADAIALWTQTGLVAPSDREERVSQLVALALVDGEAVAVATAKLEYLPPLKCRVAMYRCMVAPPFRQHAISYRLSGYARGVLEDWSREHPEENVLGMAAEIHAQQYREKQREPTWPEHGLHLDLIGYSRRDLQIRMAWFEHARV